MQQEEVHAQLARVYDPELDEPLTELGFIGGVSIADGTVEVGFRLPTYWCAGNFAFMMASDIRERVLELPWVKQVEVRLQDHFLDEEINAGVNGGKSFQKTFPDETTEDLQELRETFRAKAFHARQERLLRLLIRERWQEERILRLQVGELTGLLKGATWQTLVERFLEVRQQRGLSGDPEALAFSHPDGTPIDTTNLHSYLREAASMRLTMEFNSTLCRGMLKTRYGEIEESDKPLAVSVACASGCSSKCS